MEQIRMYVFDPGKREIGLTTPNIYRFGEQPKRTAHLYAGQLRIPIYDVLCMRGEQWLCIDPGGHRHGFNGSDVVVSVRDLHAFIASWHSWPRRRNQEQQLKDCYCSTFIDGETIMYGTGKLNENGWFEFECQHRPGGCEPVPPRESVQHEAAA